jgi:hypothetical protein
MISGALGCAGLLVLTLVSPAAGARVAPGPRPGAGCGHGCGTPAAAGGGADCQDASMNAPPSGPGDLKLAADVADADTVAPGQDIMLRLTWDPTRWSGMQLDRALQCVRVKGELEPDLAAEEQPAANDGVFEYRLHVPDNIRPGCDICAQGFVAGTAAGGGPQELRSERHCFMSGTPAPSAPPAEPPTPPMTRPSAPPATHPPATQPATTPTTTAATPRAPSAVPAEVAGVTITRPGPDPAARAPLAAPAELPRTGSAAARTGTAGGGLALSLGGLAVIGGSGRRRRRRRNR